MLSPRQAHGKCRYDFVMLAKPFRSRRAQREALVTSRLYPTVKARVRQLVMQRLTACRCCARQFHDEVCVPAKACCTAA
jgi:hypothetical protein